MLDYVPKAHARSQHQAPNKPQHQPYPYVKPNYEAKAQYSEDRDTSTLLPKEDKNFIQEVIGTFLYYAWGVNSTMLDCYTTGKPNWEYNERVQQCLDYASTHPDAIVMYHKSDMVLAGHSNASYLSKSKAHRRAGGHFFMFNSTAKPPNNGAILTIAQIIKAVMSLVAEAVVGALYIMPYSWIHGPSPTADTNANGQHHCT
jgi:hypothetical protein